MQLTSRSYFSMAPARIDVAAVSSRGFRSFCSLYIDTSLVLGIHRLHSNHE